MPDIAIWNRCNNHCVMCTNPQSFQQEDNSTEYYIEAIKTRWANQSLSENDTICLTGGEPTIHPDFLEIIHWFREEYPNNQIVIATNGRRFYYKKFTKECLKTNNLKIEIAIHGDNAKAHDAITRTKRSFEQAVKGIHNILENKNSSHELEIRIIVTKLNYKRLNKILAFIQKEFPDNSIDTIVLVFIEMEGQAQDNFNAVGITYKQVAKYVSSAIHNWSGLFRDLRLYHFPLCILEHDLWKYTWRTLGKNEVKFLPQCKDCHYKKYCLGIPKDYLEMVGDQEFKPVKKKILIKPGSSFFHPISGVSEP